MPTRNQFQTAIIGVCNASGWSSWGQQQRRDALENAVRGLPGIWPIISGLPGAVLEYLFDQLANFSGPPINMGFMEWFEQWWQNTIGYAIQWATDPVQPEGI